MPSRSEPRVITPAALRDWPLPVPTGGKDNRGTVLVVGHEAVVYLLRYLVEGLTEPELMAVARGTPVANCSITTWRRDGDGSLALVDYNRVDHLHAEGAAPTREEGVRAEPV